MQYFIIQMLKNGLVNDYIAYKYKENEKLRVIHPSVINLLFG